MKGFPKRGEVWLANWNPSRGSEQAGKRPALVIQNDIGNQVSALTIVAAITTNLRVADLPVGVRIEPAESGLPRPSAVHLGHIYTVDKQRLQRRMGQLPVEVMRQIDAAVQVSLGLRPFDL